MQVDWHINSNEIPKSMVDEFLATQRDQTFFQSNSFIEFYQKNNFNTLPSVLSYLRPKKAPR